jgi:hypothetical protein
MKTPESNMKKKENMVPPSETAGGWTVYLTQEEAAILLRSFKPDPSSSGFTEAEAEFLWNWAEQTRLRNTMLELALEGKIGFSIKNGELVCHANVETHGP